MKTLKVDPFPKISEEVRAEAERKIRAWDDAWRKELEQTNWVWEIKTIRWDCHEVRKPQDIASYVCARTVEELWKHKALKLDRANKAVEIVEIRRLYPLVEVS